MRTSTSSTAGPNIPPRSVPISRNYFLVAGVVAAQGVHILALYTPILQDVLQVQPVTLIEWLSLLALASSVVIVMEVYKAIRKRRSGDHPTGTAPKTQAM